MTRVDPIHLNPPTNLAPGVYPSDPQGHTLLVGEEWNGAVRSLTVGNMGGMVEIGGLRVTDPDILDQLADRLHVNADRLRHEQAHPYRPGIPGVAGCAVCGGRS